LKIPTQETTAKKLRKLTTDRGRILAIERFLNAYSHAVAGSTGITYPDMAELGSVIGAVLGMLEESDKTHYEALISAVA